MSGSSSLPVAQVFQRWRLGGFGVHHGSFSSYWESYLLRDPAMTGLSMCVELVFGGDRYVRLTFGPRDVTTTSGVTGEEVTFQPFGADEPSVAFTMAIGSASAQTRRLRIRFPAEHLAPNALGRMGRPLAGWGEVSLNYDGGDHDERIVLLRGDMVDGVTAGRDEGGDFVECSLADPKDAVDLWMPPYVVDSDTFGGADDRAMGARYPVVLSSFANIPALPVDTANDRFLACLGHGWTIDDVKVNGASYSSGDAVFGWSALETVDGQGTAVTLIAFSGSHTWDYSESVHVSVSGDVTCSDLIGAIRYVVEGFSGLGPWGTSRALFAQAAARLSAFPVAAVVNGSGAGSATRALSYVESGLLQGLPMVSMVWDRGGYGPVVVDRRAAPVMELVQGAGHLVGRAESWRETAKDQASNRIAVRYSYNAVTNVFAGVTLRDASNSDLCRLSMQWAGPRDREPVELIQIDDETAAAYVSDWILVHETLPSVDVVYPCNPALLLLLRRGDNVSLTDDDFGWSDLEATVVGFEYARPVSAITLRVWNSYYELGGAAGAVRYIPEGVSPQ